MNEARRFLRYLLPGLLYALESLGLLAVVLPSVALDAVSALKAEGNFSFLVTMFIASGALGFLFSTLHHWCHWYLDSKSINHTEFIAMRRHESAPCKSIADAEKKKNGLFMWLKRRKKKRQEREEAFIKLLALWYTRLQPDGQLASADKKTVSLGDIAHATGTARIASLFAVLTVQVICFHSGQPSFIFPSVARYSGFLILGVLIIVLFENSYRRTSRIAQQVIESILGKVLDDEANKANSADAKNRAAD